MWRHMAISSPLNKKPGIFAFIVELYGSLAPTTSKLTAEIYLILNFSARRLRNILTLPLPDVSLG